MNPRAGFNAAVDAIERGEACACSLWLMLCDESERDGYALKPQPWEGRGQYQRVEYTDGRSVLVRLPDDGPFSLPCAAGVTP